MNIHGLVHYIALPFPFQFEQQENAQLVERQQVLEAENQWKTQRISSLESQINRSIHTVRQSLKVKSRHYQYTPVSLYERSLVFVEGTR